MFCISDATSSIELQPTRLQSSPLSLCPPYMRRSCLFIFCSRTSRVWRLTLMFIYECICLSAFKHSPFACTRSPSLRSLSADHSPADDAAAVDFNFQVYFRTANADCPVAPEILLLLSPMALRTHSIRLSWTVSSILLGPDSTRHSVFRVVIFSFSHSILIQINMACTRQCIKTSDDFVFVCCAHPECDTRTVDTSPNHFNDRHHKYFILCFNVSRAEQRETEEKTQQTQTAMKCTRNDCEKLRMAKVKLANIFMELSSRDGAMRMYAAHCTVNFRWLVARASASSLP